MAGDAWRGGNSAPGVASSSRRKTTAISSLNRWLLPLRASGYAATSAGGDTDVGVQMRMLVVDVLLATTGVAAVPFALILLAFRRGLSRVVVLVRLWCVHHTSSQCASNATSKLARS